MAHAEQPIKIDFVGVSKRMRTTYEMALATRRDNQFIPATSGETAQIVMVDIDGVGAIDSWRDYQARHPECISIAISAAHETVEGHLATLRKPVRHEEFLAALAKAAKILRAKEPPAHHHGRTGAATHHRRQDIHAGAQATRPPDIAGTPAPQHPIAATSAPVPEKRNEASTAAVGRKEMRGGDHAGSLPDSEPDTQTITLRLRPAKTAASSGATQKTEALDPAWWKKLRMSSHSRLLGHLRHAVNQAQETRRPCALFYRGELLLIVSADGKRVELHESEGLLERLAALAIPADAVTLLPRPGDEAAGNTGQPIESLLWKMGQWTYRGHMPIELDPRMPYCLHRWPNLTRLGGSAHAMRLAAMFVRQPMTITYAATRLGIAPLEVVGFCACAHSARLLVPAKQGAESPIEVNEASEEMPQPPVERSMLRRFAGYLRRLMT